MPIKGLNVLFLQGWDFSWDYKFLMVSIATQQDIHVEGLVIKAAAQGERGALSDEEFATQPVQCVCPQRPPGHIPDDQAAADAGRGRPAGAGLMMLGGHASFGAGGWADTPLADILPVQIHPSDGQNEPPNGIKFVPNPKGLGSYLLQVGADKTETARIWDMMTPILRRQPLQRRQAERRHPGRDPCPAPSRF